jgi:hypothetical protein
MTGESKMGANVGRAEERLDQIAGQLGRFLKDMKPLVLRPVGRIREEAEDIVAEAKSVRSRTRS